MIHHIDEANHNFEFPHIHRHGAIRLQRDDRGWHVFINGTFVYQGDSALKAIFEFVKGYKNV